VIIPNPNTPGNFIIEAYTVLASDNSLDQLQQAYLTACTELPSQDPHTPSHTPVQPKATPRTRNSTCAAYTNSVSSPPMATYAKKKYKPVAQKVRPVLDSLPVKFRIVRQIQGDPLANMPILSPNPPHSLLPVAIPKNAAILLIAPMPEISYGPTSAPSCTISCAFTI
jgi:hypothetical protein